MPFTFFCFYKINYNNVFNNYICKCIDFSVEKDGDKKEKDKKKGGFYGCYIAQYELLIFPSYIISTLWMEI